MAGDRRRGSATAALSGTPAAAEPSEQRLVHRYLKVVIAPDGCSVASLEGDSPAGGYYPEVLDLVLRRLEDGLETRVPMPCGRVPQCWPSSPAMAS